MMDFLVVGTTAAQTEIYMSELSSETLHDNGLDGDSSGLYLYEACEEPHARGIRVLAAIPNADAAYRLLDLMGVTRAA